MKTKKDTEQAIKSLAMHVDEKDNELRLGLEVLQEDQAKCMIEIKNGIKEILTIISKK